MRFGPGSEMEQWLHDRHLFGTGVVLCVLFALAVVALTYVYTLPDPACGRTAAANGECRLNVDHGG